MGADPALVASQSSHVSLSRPSGFDPGEGGERLFVHSGKVRFCSVGTPIGKTDMRGRPLFTGDIVVIWTDGCLTVPEHLTVVVRKEFQSWNTGASTRHDPIAPGEPFVMGIASVPLDETGEWNVLRVKSYRDVIHGEHWAEYGFNYALARIEAGTAETGNTDSARKGESRNSSKTCRENGNG